MPGENLSDSDSRRLADLLRSISDGQAQLRIDELPQIWRHQLGTPLPPPGETDSVEAEGVKPAPKTFGALLQHGSPPMDLLLTAKDYAKSERKRLEGRVLRQVATVLYYACIAAGCLRIRRQLSSLTDAEMVSGFSWVLDQDWVDAETHLLVRQAHEYLSELG